MIKFFKKYYFVFIPIVITVLCAVFGLVRYIINDDIAMLKIAESFKTNTHSEHLVFISVIFGYLLKMLYSILPGINWFIIMYLATVNLAFIALFGIVKKLGENIVGFCAVAAIQIFILSNLTFTSISFICATAGMLWMIVFIDKLDKASLIHFVIGFVLLLSAYAMRRGDTFYFTILLFIPVFFFSLIKKRKKIAVIASIIIVCTVANYSVVGVQNLYNNSIPSDIYFSEFRKYRGAANDDGLFNYERHGQELQESGVTENDYYLLRRWIFGDKKVYSAETMKAVAQSRDFDEKYNTNLKEIAKQILKQRTVLLLLAALILMTVINIIISKKQLLEALGVFAFTIAGFGYLYFRRRGIERVSSLVLICGFLVLLFMLLNSIKSAGEIKLFKKINPKAIRALVSVLCIVAVILSALYCVRNNNRFDTEADKFSKAAQYFNNDRENFYVCDVRVSSDYVVKYYNDRIFKVNAGKDINFYGFLGTWTMYTYYYYDNLNNLGYKEYYDNLISLLLRDEVRFVSRKLPPQKLAKFFKENYNIDVKYKVEKKFKDGDYKVYKFYQVNQ